MITLTVTGRTLTSPTTILGNERDVGIEKIKVIIPHEHNGVPLNETTVKIGYLLVTNSEGGNDKITLGIPTEADGLLTYGGVGGMAMPEFVCRVAGTVSLQVTVEKVVADVVTLFWSSLENAQFKVEETIQADTNIASAYPTIIQQLQAKSDYALSVGATLLSPADIQTYYWGGLPAAVPVTISAQQRLYIPKSGTIKTAYLFVMAITAGTDEEWKMYIRLNNTTDYEIAKVSLDTSERLFINASLDIDVIAGDYIEIKEVCPTWATNPVNVRRSGTIYITTAV